MSESENQSEAILIESLFQLVYGAIRAWQGSRLLILGASGVGKTTLWRYLETGKIVNPESVEKTLKPTQLGGQEGKIKIKDIKIAGIKTRLAKAVDLPGDKEFRSTWRPVVDATKPEGIIFLMDHALNPRTVPSIGYDSVRLQEHYETLDHLTKLILNNDSVKTNLQAFLVLVNKSDSFPSQLGYGDIIREANVGALIDRLRGIENLRIKSRQCSALYGENIQEEISWMVRNML